MLAETGQILLLLSLSLAALQGVFGIWGAHALNGRLMAFADRAADLITGNAPLTPMNVPA